MLAGKICWINRAIPAGILHLMPKRLELRYYGVAIDAMA